MDRQHVERTSPLESLDFANFLDAVRTYELDETEVRTTAHTSSVSVEDWEQLQALRTEAASAPADSERAL